MEPIISQNLSKEEGLKTGKEKTWKEKTGKEKARNKDAKYNSKQKIKNGEGRAPASSDAGAPFLYRKGTERMRRGTGY